YPPNSSSPPSPDRASPRPRRAAREMLEEARAEEPATGAASRRGGNGVSPRNAAAATRTAGGNGEQTPAVPRDRLESPKDSGRGDPPADNNAPPGAPRPTAPRGTRRAAACARPCRSTRGPE